VIKSRRIKGCGVIDINASLLRSASGSESYMFTNYYQINAQSFRYDFFITRERRGQIYYY
jgi:hypothetical protein